MAGSPDRHQPEGPIMNDAEEFAKAHAALMTAVEKISVEIMPLFATVAKYYESLPQSMKEEIARIQVGDIVKDIPPEAVHPEDHWVHQRLKDYEQYWNPKTKKYHVEDDWIVTKNELIEDLRKSYRFEHGTQQ